jgi:diguanylate cyclase (GGDEF)-like protein
MRRVLRRLRAFAIPRRDPWAQASWLPDAMLRTSWQVAVFVFHGEATIAQDLVVTRRGPGRDALLGGPAPDRLPIDWAAAVHPEDRARFRTAESYAQLRKGRPLAVEYRLVGADGIVRWVEERLVPRVENGRLLVDGVVVDVTAQVAARRAAEEAQRRLETVMRLAHTYVWVADVDCDGTMRAVYALPGIEQLLGGPATDDDAAPAPWRDAVHPDDVGRFDAALDAARTGEPFDLEYRLVGRDGVTRIVRDQAMPTLRGAGAFRLEGLIREVTAEYDARRSLAAALEVAEDRAVEVEELLAQTSSLHALAEQAKLSAENRARELAAAHAELEWLAAHDALTGLMNRRHATPRMEAAIAGGEPVGIAMLDVDRFKQVNDTHGHAGGDAVLVELARRLAATRAGDIVARWGGEEFAVLLTGVADETALRAAAERLRAAVAATPVILDGGIEVAVTVSVGVCRCASADEPLEALVRAADDALYAAKRAGRDRVRCAPDRLRKAS